MAAATTPPRRGLVALAAVLVLVLVMAGLSVSASAAPRPGKRYKVGGPDGWRLPPPEEKEKFYANWASPITFYVGDTLEFVYRNDSVIEVDKAGYYHCNETVADSAPRDGSALFLLEFPGDAYFASADRGRCDMGERLAVAVVAPAADHPPAQAPSPPVTPPATPQPPAPWSWAPSFGPAAAEGPSSTAHHHSAAAAGRALFSSPSAAPAIVIVLVVPAIAVALAAGFI